MRSALRAQSSELDLCQIRILLFINFYQKSRMYVKSRTNTNVPLTEVAVEKKEGNENIPEAKIDSDQIPTQRDQFFMKQMNVLKRLG